MTDPAKTIAYIRTRKGGERPKPSGSFTDVKFSELCLCIGFESAVGFAKYTEIWNSKAPIVLTYKAYMDYENNSRNAAINE